MLALVTVYDVPYKVTDRSAHPGTLSKQIRKKEGKLSKLLVQSSKDHPKITKIRRQINELRAKLARVNTEWEWLVYNEMKITIFVA